MLDCIKLTISYQNWQEIERIISANNFEFVGEKNTANSTTFGQVIYTYKLNNLRVKVYTEALRIEISNSLHKFFHGNNYTDYTYNDVSETVEILQNIFFKAKDEFIIKRLECGVNVITPNDPIYYIDQMNGIKMKPFYFAPPPTNVKQSIEKFCPAQQRNVKFYDTGKWNDVKNQNILRYEVVFKKMQPIYKISKLHSSKNPLTFVDLIDKDFWSKMIEYMKNTYHSIDKGLGIEYPKLTGNERALIFAGHNTKFWDIEKAINCNTCKKKRAKYLRLYKEAKINIDELEVLIFDKFDHLINS